jgi:hypothetical protein
MILSPFWTVERSGMGKRCILGALLALIVLAGSGQAALEPDQPDMGCTVFYATDGQVALGGNNEDFVNPFTKVWFIPADEGQYGRVYFGYENYIWSGGMNDQGLFFDAMAVDQPVRVPRDGKPVYPGTLADKAMAECATTDCVLGLFEQYHTYDTWYHQFLFGDATGTSAIIEPLTALRNEGGYQVGTNFYQSMTPEHQRTCPRYRAAMRLFEGAGTLSVDLFREILDATHVEGQSVTLYSNVYDLTNRVVYLYFYHDYENVVVLDLEEELSKGARSVDLPSLFPPNEVAERWAAPVVARLQEGRQRRPTADVGASTLEKYMGRYEVPEEMGVPYPFFGVMFDGDTLVLQVKTDKAWYPLTPQSETSFYHLSVHDDFSVTFVPEASGGISHMLYEQGGQTYVLNRLAQAETQPGVVPSVDNPAAPQPQMGQTGASPGVASRFTPALALIALGGIMACTGLLRRRGLS